MSQETEIILRTSLDEVDRIRKRQIAAFVFFLCTLLALLIWLGYISESRTADMRKMLLGSVFVLVWAMVYVAMALAMSISRMTKKILQAIELLSKE